MTEPKKPVLPHGWVVKQSTSYPDRVYFFNIHTGNSTWEVPTLQNQEIHGAKQKHQPTKSCLSKPTVSKQPGPTSQKKTVKIAPEPQFSPEIDDNSDDDLLDLSDGAANEGHKHHMEILQRPPSPLQMAKTDHKIAPTDSATFLDHDIHLASVHDVDMRRGPQSGYHYGQSSQLSLPMKKPLAFSFRGDNQTPHISQFSASMVSAPIYQSYGEQSVVDNFDGVVHVENSSQFPLKLPITPSKCNSFMPHTPSDLPSMDKDLSTSVQTLPSVHSDRLPDYLRFSSTPIVKQNNVGNTLSARFQSNSVSETESMDKDFRIQRTVKNEQTSNTADTGPHERSDERKRRLSELLKSQKNKKFKTDVQTNSDNTLLSHQISTDSSRPTKALGANDLRHKVMKKHETMKSLGKNNDLRTALIVQKNTTPINDNIKNVKIKPLMDVDVRKVVSCSVPSNCDMQVLRYDSTIERDRSPVDSDENNIVETEDVHIAPDKLLSIQTWIDNIEPGTGHLLEDEDTSSKRTSPDSAVLSITYSNDFDNRRIVVEKGPPYRTVDSGISSVSNATVFQPITDTWKSQQTHHNNCWKGVHADQVPVDHNRDIIDMEIDEVQHTLAEADNRDIEDMEVANIVVKEIRAKFQSNCKFSEVVGDLTQMVSHDSHLTKSFSHYQDLLIVVDTNILISHLTFIQDLRDTFINSHGKPILVFPWVVMQELDYLKSGKTASASLSLATAKKARDAVQYLYHCLQTNHPRIVGQTPVQASVAAGEFLIENNDDRVLQCCKQFQSFNQDCMVVLLTDDRNLCNKSLIMGIKAFTQQLILSQLQTMDRVMTCQGDATIAGYQVKPRSNQVQPTSQTIEQPIILPRVRDNDSSFLDDTYCKVKSLIKGAFSVILEREMRRVYDEIWRTIIFKKPPWSLRDVLECVQKHWIAVFGQIYRRDLVKNVERLLDIVITDGPVVWRVILHMIYDTCEVLDEDLRHLRSNPEIANYKKSFLDLRSRIPLSECVQQPSDQNKQLGRQKSTSPHVVGNHGDTSQGLDSSGNNSSSPHVVGNRGDTSQGLDSSGNNSTSPHVVGNRGDTSQGLDSSGNNSSSPHVVGNHGDTSQGLDSSGNNSTSPYGMGNHGDTSRGLDSSGNNSTSPHVVGNRGDTSQGLDSSGNYNNKTKNLRDNKHRPVSHRKRRKSGDKKKQNGKSSASSGQPTFSKSELKLKSIWNTIQQFCNELKRVVYSSNSPQRHVYQMCEKLLPAMTDLEMNYNKALSIPAGEIRSRLELVIELCNHLNSFHDRLEIEDMEGPIETYDLLDLFAKEDKRSTLQDGLRQLKDLVKEIFICVQQLPDD